VGGTLKCFKFSFHRK